MKSVISELKKVGSELTALSVGESRIEKVVDEFSKTAETVFVVTKGKIEAESTAKDASKKMSLKLTEIVKKLHEIDAKIKNIQRVTSEKLSSATSMVVKASDRIRDLYDISKILRAVEVAFDEVKRSDNKMDLDLARGKFNLAISKALNADFFKAKETDKDIKKLYDALKDVQTRVVGKDGFAETLDTYLTKHDAEIKKKADAVEKQMSGKLYSITSEISSYIDTQFEDITFSNADLKKSVNVSVLASNVLLLSSELTSIGYSIERGASKLLLTQNAQELSAETNSLSTSRNIQKVIQNNRKIRHQVF